MCLFYMIKIILNKKTKNYRILKILNNIFLFYS